MATHNETSAQVQTVHTNERVPGHSNYYEKNGLRTYGDDAEHEHEPPVYDQSISDPQGQSPSLTEAER